uniref:Ig-like domain-containing protein n=1 Tax=Malurus cyaneus samueli TaxID=2593467 RepID=A0A8C5TXU7_9PASS
ERAKEQRPVPRFTVPAWSPVPPVFPAGVPLSGVPLSAQPPGGRVALGDRLVLSCSVAAGTGPLSFSWHRGGSGAPLGTGPRLELRHVRGNDSGHYQCRANPPAPPRPSVGFTTPPPNPVCYPVPPAPQFLPWDPSLSSRLCSAAPPSAFGVARSPQPNS